MAGTLYTGTSGFAYDEWKHGVFYPEGLKNADMLSYYASRFRSVEVNYTFRRFPTEKTLAGWREGTPQGFVFTLKANQRITHFKRLADADDDVRDFLRLAKLLGDRLGTVLFQCPPTLKYDRQLIEQFVGSLPPDVRAVMEFRDPSWNEAREFLHEQRVAWCVAETDEKDPGPDDLSWDPYGYLRLRKTDYSDEELQGRADLHHREEVRGVVVHPDLHRDLRTRSGIVSSLLLHSVLERQPPIDGLAERGPELAPAILADPGLERPLHLEHVQGHSVVRGEDLCREDGQSGERQGPGDPRQQAGTVRGDDRERVGTRPITGAGERADLVPAHGRAEQGEVPRCLLSRRRQEITAGHAFQETLDLGRPLVREEGSESGSQRLQPVRRPRSQLPSLQDPLNLGHQLANERGPPRRPREWARGERVGHRQQVQRCQPFGIAHPGGDVEHQVAVLQVAARRGVRQQQVLRDQEQREIARVGRQAHSLERGRRLVHPDRHVVPQARLPDVVQQRAEQEAIPLWDRGGGLRDERVALVAAIEEPGHPSQGIEQVHVHRASVIRVALRSAPDRFPLREEAGQDPEPVQRLQRPRALLAGPHDRQECLANGVGPLDLFLDQHVLDPVERGGPHDPSLRRHLGEGP